MHIEKYKTSEDLIQAVHGTLDAIERTKIHLERHYSWGSSALEIEQYEQIRDEMEEDLRQLMAQLGYRVEAVRTETVVA